MRRFPFPPGLFSPFRNVIRPRISIDPTPKILLLAHSDTFSRSFVSLIAHENVSRDPMS